MKNKIYEKCLLVVTSVLNTTIYLFIYLFFFFAFLYSRTWKLQNNEDCASSVKVFTKKQLDIKAYNCLICGQRSGKEGLRKLQEKGITTSIKSLKLQNECNDYNVSYFLPFIDFEKNISISETDLVR